MGSEQNDDMRMLCPLKGGHGTVEAVGPGHPDKICDQISDAVVDAALAGDPNSRVAVETTGKTKIRLIGEMTTNAKIDLPALAMRVHREIGYDDNEVEGVEIDVSQQSSDIALGTNDQVRGAGDQGTMVGYAVNTPDYNYMPIAYALAQRLVQRLVTVREEGTLTCLRPDCKSQVVMDNGHVRHVTVATQHVEDIGLDELRKLVHEHVIVPVVGDIGLNDCTINGTGKFVLGSFKADSGLTGRKIVVDAYGTYVPVGGGAFSGKDPTKVDRTAAYMARHIAKSMVARHFADEVRVYLAYTIGQVEPDSVRVIAHGGDPVFANERFVRDNFPLSPAGMIEYLGLKAPRGWSYQQTAMFGHFGHDEFPWEQIKQ